MAKEGKTDEKVSILMGLVSDGLEKDLQKIENTIVNGISGIAKKVAAPLAAFFSFQAVSQIFNEMTNEMDALNKTSKQMGVSVDNLHAWQEAAKSAGGSAEGLNTSVSTLSKKLQMIDISGKSSATPFLKELGINALDSTGKARDALEVMEEISGKIDGMDKQKSSGILQSLGLDSGSIMLLQSGKTNLQALLKEQKEIGVYTEKDAALAGEYKDSLEKLSRTFKMSLLPIVTRALSIMTKLTSEAAKGVKYLRDHFQAFIPVLIGVSMVILSKILPAIGALSKKMLAFLFSPWGMALMALLAIGLAIEDLIVWMNGGKSAFGDFWESLFGNKEYAKEVFESLKAVLGAIVDVLISSLKGLLSFIGTLLGAIIMFFTIVFMSFLRLVALLKELPKIISRGIEKIKSAFQIIKDAVLNHLRPVIEIIKLWWSYIQLVESAIKFLIAVIFGSDDATEEAFNSMMEKWKEFKSQCMSVVDSIADKLEWLFGLFSKAKNFVSGLNLPSFNAGFSSPALALGGTGGMMTENNDNRQMSAVVNQTYNINSNDPRTTANIVGGNNKQLGNDITNQMNSGSGNM